MGASVGAWEASARASIEATIEEATREALTETSTELPMGPPYVRVPKSLLVDPQLSTSSKVVWMALQLEASGARETRQRSSAEGASRQASPPRTSRVCVARLAARAGVSRPTVYKAMRELSATGWLIQSQTPRDARVATRKENVWVDLPAHLVTDNQIGASAKVFYGLLQLAQSRLPKSRLPSRSQKKQLEFTFSLLAKLLNWHRKTVAKAVRSLANAGWLLVLRKNHRHPAHCSFKDPRLAASEAEVEKVKRRLQMAKFVGEALMREYLSLLIDSDEYEDNAAPGFLVNPLTEERLQLDRYYPPGVAFEFNGPQHYGPTQHYTAEEAANQRVRDLIKAGICASRGIQLKIVHAEDLSLSKMKKIVGHLLPLRDLRHEGPRIRYLESVSRLYRRKAQRSQFSSARALG